MTNHVGRLYSLARESPGFCRPIAKIRQSPCGRPGQFSEDAGMRVLIVEDEDAIALPLAEGLAREGFDVVRASTGVPPAPP